jgi:hypothetical protein
MQAIQATYHDGVFSPTNPIALVDGQAVMLWVDIVDERSDLSDKDDLTWMDEVEVRREEVLSGKTVMRNWSDVRGEMIAELSEAKSL